MNSSLILFGILMLSVLDHIICKEADEDVDGNSTIVYSTGDKIWKKKFDSSDEPELIKDFKDKLLLTYTTMKMVTFGRRPQAELRLFGAQMLQRRVMNTALESS